MKIFPRIYLEIERWKYNKNYQIFVSNLGNFKDKNKKDIKVTMDASGYLTIPLCNNKKGIVKYVFAHRIVMETWCPQQDMWQRQLTVDHIDHNKRNNKLKNLEWVTAEENTERAAQDMIRDDKDILIQQLKSKIKILETCKSEAGYVAAAVGVQKFKNWQEVKEFLSQKNPNYKDMTEDKIITRILNACNGNKPYMNYRWKIL